MKIDFLPAYIGRGEGRFWPKVNLSTSGCWLWNAGKNPRGYGRFWNGSHLIMAHRYSWELHNSKIPKGLQIDHLCRNRLCVNPAHLEPVTQQENIRRGEAGKHRAEECKNMTHCKRGHEFTPANTGTGTHGERRCRTCMAMLSRKHRKKKAGKGYRCRICGMRHKYAPYVYTHTKDAFIHTCHRCGSQYQIINLVARLFKKVRWATEL